MRSRKGRLVPALGTIGGALLLVAAAWPAFAGAAAQPTAGHEPRAVTQVVPGVIRTPSSVAVTEGGASAAYSLQLTAAPTGTVTIILGSAPSNEVTAVGQSSMTNQLTFTTANWHLPQLVVVSAVNDSEAEGNHSALVSHAISGGGYGGVSIGSVTVQITDNDGPGVVLSESTVQVSESGTTDTYSVVLTTQPSGTVTVSLGTTPGGEVTARSVVGDNSFLTFTQANWDSPQFVRVRAVNDGQVEGTHAAFVTHDASGGGYGAVAIPNVTALITDNDALSGDDDRRIIVSERDVTVTEGGSAETYTVRLSHRPTNSVVVTLSTSPGGEATARSQATGNDWLVFSTTNWDDPQTVVVRAVNDSQDEATQTIEVRHTPSDSGGYDDAPVREVDVTVRDNDGPSRDSKADEICREASSSHPSLKALCRVLGQVPPHVRPIIERVIEKNAAKWLDDDRGHGHHGKPWWWDGHDDDEHDEDDDD